MFYHNMTDDDGEFRPSESTMSNLTSLFDSNKPHPNENHSLTYVAPKAPKPGESYGTLKQSGSKSSSHKELKIITSKSVRVYKLERGIYVNQGTAGIAIVGNHGLHLYQVILYKSNQDHLCKTHITPNFSFTVLENNYVSFYDTSGQNWSILFSSSCNVQEFAKQVAIAKYNSQINQERIIVQDLSPLDGPKGKKGDLVKVAYTCSVLENDEIVPWKEKGTAMIELTDVNAFPWHEGIKDWSEHCMRILIIPYKLSAPWKNDINENTSVVMELELVNITSSCSDKPGTQKEKEKEKSDEADVGMKTKGGDVMENSGDEGYCKGKVTSLKDSLLFSRSHKTNIISRIARIGQGLPVSGSIVSGPSDSEDECSSMLRQGMNLTSVKNAVQQLHRSLPVHLGQSSTEAKNSHCNNADDEIHRNEKITWSQEQKKMRRVMNVAAEEWEPCRNIEENESEGSRCSATSFVDRELRTSIHKLSEKVDEVLKKLQSLDYSKVDRLEERESGGVMDPINVLTSIPDFIVEHENLKTEMELQRLAIDEQNKKIEILTDLTQRCVEKCSITERKVTVEKRQMMVSEKQVPKSEWSETNGHTNEPPCGAGQCRKEESLENQGVRYRDRLIEDLGKKQDGVHDSERKLDHTVADKECQVSWNGGEKKEILNDRMKGNEETCPGSKALESISCEDSFEDIKRVMNAVNKKLQSYFEPGMNYSGSEVKAIIASTIKDVTMEYLRYKLKLRWPSGTEFSGKYPSERRFEGLREQRTQGEQQECSSHSHVREILDFAGNSDQRSSHDIRSITSSKYAVNMSGKDTESRLGVEKSRSCAGEVESNRSKVSLEPSGISRVSDITAATRDDYYGRDIGEGGMKSTSDSEEKYSKASSQVHRLSFANKEPILENIGETGNRGKRSFPSSRKTLTDAKERSVVGSSSLRLDNAGMTFSENQTVSQQEIIVGSKSLIECEEENDLGDEKYEISICKDEEDTKRVIKSPSPSQKFISIAEGNTLESGKITLNNSPRVSGDEKVGEVGEGVVEIAESSKLVVSEFTRRDAVKTISQPYTVTVDNEESLNKSMDGNGLDAQGAVRAKSKTVVIGGAEAKKSGKNVKDEISEKMSNVGSKALPSFQSMSSVRSKGSRVDNTFGEYNSGVSFRTPETKGVENGEVEMLDENLTGLERDVEKSTALTESLSDISASRDENSNTDINFRNVTDSSGIAIYSAGEADVAASVVESNSRNGESKNENLRGEGFESGNAKLLAVEENSDGSGTEKAVSLSKTTIPDGIEPGGASDERSTVSGLTRSVIEEDTASSSVRMKGNCVENNGVTSRHDTSNLWEVVESRPFSTRSTVIGKESVTGVDFLRGEDGEIGSTDGKAKDQENEKGEMESGSLNDHDQESLTGQENIKSSGATSANGACHFPDYYQNWVLSKPPPLPLEEEDDEDDDDINTVDNDEEWL